jgi:uroporphyrinogen decarboxylase
MNACERVLGALERTGYDRIPVHHEGTPEVNAQLRAHLGVAGDDDLLYLLGEDLRRIRPRYVGPELRQFPDGSTEGLWGERYNDIPYGDGLGTYPEAVYLPFAGLTDVAQLADLPFPSADWYAYDTIEAQCDVLRDYALVIGGAGDLDFMNGIARCRGVEQVLFDVATADPVYLELVERRFQFFYEVAERTLQAAHGKIHLLHCGEDLGTQRGPIISLKAFERLFATYYQRYFELAHRYGARAMMHSGGSVRAFLPRLIEMGLDVLDVVQVAADGMDLEGLQHDFGRDLCFCGTMCVQSILPFGTQADVERETRRRMELFAEGGLILGPTHAIQVLTPLENILAMYRTAGSLAAGW